MTAELEIVRTSEHCDSYRLYANGVLVWSCRVWPSEDGKREARALLKAWNAGRYQIVMKAEAAA